MLSSYSPAARRTCRQAQGAAIHSIRLPRNASRLLSTSKLQSCGPGVCTGQGRNKWAAGRLPARCCSGNWQHILATLLRMQKRRPLLTRISAHPSRERWLCSAVLTVAGHSGLHVWEHKCTLWKASKRAAVQDQVRYSCINAHLSLLKCSPSYEVQAQTHAR